MKEGQWVWLNGKFIPLEKATIPIKCQANMYGAGCFEGLRFYKTEGGRRVIFRLRDHLERWTHSMEALGIKPPFSMRELIQATIETVRKNDFEEGYIRPWAGYTERRLGLSRSKATKVSFAVFVDEWKSYFPRPVRLKVSPFVRPHPQSFPMNAKICGVYVNSLLAQTEARDRGYDEALLLDYQGNIAETAVSNIFAVCKDWKFPRKEVFTPPTGAILPGITRDTIIKILKMRRYKVHERNFSLRWLLLNATEVFICGTAAEIVPVASVKLKDAEFLIGPTKNGAPGPATSEVQGFYAAVVKDKVPGYRPWLTYVD
jgi:branched-chain amino acid aminotransferase